MAVGRGSMERAAKAAGTDNTRKSTEGKGLAPARRMTISEIVGETSMVEPPEAARRPADKAVGNKIIAARRPEKKPEEKNKAVPEKKPEEEKKAVPEKKPEVDNKAVAEKKPAEESKAVREKKPTAEERRADAVEKTMKETAEGIVYQRSSGMLERAAEPNERFGLGDAMPVYYF